MIPILRTAAICAGLALITLAVYWRVLSHGFLIYDDQQYVTGNPHVRGGISWARVAWAIRTFYASNWHPLTWISHMLDCQWYGLRPMGHHLTNLLLHMGNTVLLFLVLKRSTGGLWRSVVVAGLFAWHPLHVESVAWIAERKDVLSAFWFLGTVWAYVRYWEGTVGSNQFSVTSNQRSENKKSEVRSQRSESANPNGQQSSRLFFYLLALVMFALGLMSKPMLVTLPFVLLLLDYWPLRRGSRVER